MVPIFSAASWASLTSLRAAFWIDPFRDVYEAFTIYTFFQLLVNYIGGERALIVTTHGRPPVQHLWPINKLPGISNVDISDPHTFLWIKRGILQYAYTKPVLCVTTIVLKATGTFEEGIISWKSGYLWTSLIYNVSICWSLYDLALFWVCMSTDMQPFRPMPKFLCIKGIIFASWWQGFFLSILVWLGAIKSAGGGYTADNLAAAIQDALICFEMPFFAVSHWYAFSWKDYADQTISDARMPIRFAMRDAFGPRDLIEDAKETWSGQKYEYRYFDAEDNVIAHEQSTSREARMREGMRYERGGRGKYWIPDPGQDSSKQPLLSHLSDGRARAMSPGGNHESRSSSHGKSYGATHDPEEPELDPDEDRYYAKARELEFGDWNYPVINTHYATREDRLHGNPNTISTSTNAAILQPSAVSRQRRKSRIQNIKANVHQGGASEASSPAQEHEANPSSGSSSGKGDGFTEGIVAKGKEKLSSLPVVGSLVRNHSSSSSASHSSQLVDLVVEDHDAEAVERMRARKEGGPGWNAVDRKHFVQTVPGEPPAEEIRQGFNPDRPERGLPGHMHNMAEPVEGHSSQTVDEVEGVDEIGEEQPWEGREYGAAGAGQNPWKE